jgi:manganese/zinc/iron transport system permease protein
VPPAAAFLLTNRLGWMIVISLAIAATGAVTGHVGAVAIPAMFDLGSTTTASMMAVSVGLLFLLAVLLSPHQGLLPKAVRRFSLSQQILSDDVVAFLYRRGERQQATEATRGQLGEELFASSIPLFIALQRLLRFGWLERVGERFRLTDAGNQRGEELVRSHRLWESYLVEQAELDTSRIHDKAERWEHFTDRRLREELQSQTAGNEIDPHGSEIPPEREAEQG